VNEAGLDFYDRLVDELLDAGIEPYVTLYHWDLPQLLEDAGGWPARETAEAFVEYAEAVTGRLGDRVTNWSTQNEPRVAAWLGYGLGIHAPGRHDLGGMLAAGHHILLSHGLAAEVLRRDVPGARIGIALDLNPVYPETDSEADRTAAWTADGENNRWFLDPIFRAEYPVDILEHFAPAEPPVRDGDMAAIAAAIDVLGVNYYTRRVVRAADGGSVDVYQDDSAHTDIGWEIAPQAFYELLVRLHDDYAPAAISITENGAAFEDIQSHDGQVRDPERQEYIADHIAAIGRAVEAGVPVEGYFVWSLLDNFEWAEGYRRRFGIVYVDYPTLERVPKTSFYWYRDFIARLPRAGRPPTVPAAGGR
jgi:beta-glucosidase